MAAPSHALILREGPKKTARSRGRIPRVAQEEIFSLLPVTEGPPVITERHLPDVLKKVVWSEQRERWVALRKKH
jgi:hypothetical protein